MKKIILSNSKKNFFLNIWKSTLFISIFILIFGTLVFLFINNGNYIDIYANGSTTVFPLMGKLSDEYHQVNSKERISVVGGGSTLGINLILQNRTDFADASRFPTESEYSSDAWNNNQLTILPLGLDQLVFAANVKTTSSDLSLTIQNLADIYMGKINNWKDPQLSDHDKYQSSSKIIPINRENGSGSLETFYSAFSKSKYNTNIDKKSFPTGSLVANSNGQVIDYLLNQENTIGYFSLGYLNSLFVNGKLKNTDIDFFQIKNKNDLVYPKSIWNLKNNDSTNNNIRNLFLKDTVPKIENQKDFFWHPLNIIVSLINRKIFPSTPNKASNLNSDFINWIINNSVQQSKKEKKSNNNRQIILNSGYLPIFFYWDKKNPTKFCFPVYNSKSKKTEYIDHTTPSWLVKFKNQFLNFKVINKNNKWWDKWLVNNEKN